MNNLGVPPARSESCIGNACSGKRGRKSIAIYYAFQQLYGTEIVLQRLAKEFVANGFEVSLVACSGSIPLLPEMPPSTNVISLNAPSTLRAIVPLSRFLRSHRPNILLSAYPLHNMAAVLARTLARTRTKVVLTEHTPIEPRFLAYPPGRRGVLRTILPAVYRKADAIIAVSETVKTSLRWTGVSEARLHVLHNPALESDHVTACSRAASHPWFNEASVPIVLGVGRLQPDKDFATLIRAFAQVRLQIKARLVIAGDGPALGELEKLAQELGITEHVLFTGYDSCPRMLMAKCGVFVLASLNEGSPLVLVEALSSGCPVVATATPGAADVLENGRHGYLVPLINAGALAKAIVAAMTQPHDPRPGLERAANFRVNVSAQRYLALFDRLAQADEMTE